MKTKEEIDIAIVNVLNEINNNPFNTMLRHCGFLEALLQIVGVISKGNFEYKTLYAGKFFGKKLYKKESYRQFIVRKATEYLENNKKDSL